MENAHGLEYTLSSPEVKTATSFKVFLKHSLASIKISLRLTLPVRAQTSLHGGKPQFRPVKIAHAPHVSPPLASQEFVRTEGRYCPTGDLGRLPLQLLIAPPVAPGSPEAPPRGRQPARACPVRATSCPPHRPPRPFWSFGGARSGRAEIGYFGGRASGLRDCASERSGRGGFPRLPR